MRIVSLNVNGLRAFDSKNGNDFNNFCMSKIKADICCLQEIKGSQGSLSKYHSLKSYYTFSSFFKKGIYGVSTLVKKDLFCEKTEEIVPGRILKTFHGSFILYNCYMPYHDESIEKDKTEIIKIYNILVDSIESCLKKSTKIIICGDMNATYNVLDHYQYYRELLTLIDLNKWHSHDEIIHSNRLIKYIRGFKIDENKMTLKMKEKYRIFSEILKTEDQFQDHSIFNDKIEKINPKVTELPFHFFTFEALKKYFFEIYQRKWMENILEKFHDTFRLYIDEIEQYTCWNSLYNLRPINWGTRIDYVLCTKDIECTESGIMPEIMGSDHCPVFATFKLDMVKNENKNLVRVKNNLFDYFASKK
jgi:exodeoxyribonuclease III